jgi:hypothetical protein
VGWAGEKEQPCEQTYERRIGEEVSEMHARITGHLRELVQVVNDNPVLQRIIGEDPKAATNPLLRNHIHNLAFLVGYDFLELNLKTAKMVEENKYDIAKIRRRVEEHLRKYATDQEILKLALFLGVSIN